MTDEEIQRLHELVHAAQAEVDRPWEPGETSRPIEFFTDRLHDEGWHLGWTLVVALRNDHPELFRHHGEESLHRAALDLILAAEAPPSVDELAESLLADAVDDGPWIVATPLANVALDRPWAPLGDRAALRRTGNPDPNLASELSEEAARADAKAEFAVFHHLGDRLDAAPRVLRRGSGAQIDTGRTATILSLEEGSRLAAVEAARAKAHYALATWSILSPPRDWHLLPDVGVWSPQPFLHQRAQYKRLEHEEWIAKERRRGGDYRHWAPYELPDGDVLTAPYEALACIELRPAQALLSSTTALYAAGRASRSQLSERVRDIRAAIECLCEPAGGGNAYKRWKQLAERFAIWDRLVEARAYTPEAVAGLQKRIVNARNISAHGADAALIDLGWIAKDRPLKFGKVALATDLLGPALHRDLGAMLFAVGEALRGAWAEMRAAGFKDTAFEALF